MSTLQIICFNTYVCHKCLVGIKYRILTKTKTLNTNTPIYSAELQTAMKMNFKSYDEPW